MSDKRYMPKTSIKREAWLRNFAVKLGKFGPVLNMEAAMIAAGQADALYAATALDMHQRIAHFAKSWTSFKDSTLYGNELLAGWPGSFEMPATLPPVTSAGVMRRIAKLVAYIKTRPGYHDGIGLALGIVGTDHVITHAELAEMKPVLKVRLVSGGHPVVLWRKRGMTGIELEVDRGDGKGFVYLTFDMHPDHLDQSPLPPTGTSAIWTYRGIYRKGDTRVGQWSNETKITVAGI